MSARKPLNRVLSHSLVYWHGFKAETASILLPHHAVWGSKACLECQHASALGMEVSGSEQHWGLAKSRPHMRLARGQIDLGNHRSRNVRLGLCADVNPSLLEQVAYLLDSKFFESLVESTVVPECCPF